MPTLKQEFLNLNRQFQKITQTRKLTRAEIIQYFELREKYKNQLNRERQKRFRAKNKENKYVRKKRTTKK